MQSKMSLWEEQDIPRFGTDTHGHYSCLRSPSHVDSRQVRRAELQQRSVQPDTGWRPGTQRTGMVRRNRQVSGSEGWVQETPALGRIGVGVGDT